MKYRFAQRTMAMTLMVSLTSGLAMNAVMYDFAYAQQTGGSGNGNSSNTNGNSGNSNGNGASTSTGNQGNGNNGNNGNGNNGNGNGNNGNGNGNNGNGNGNGNNGNHGNGNNGNGNGNHGNHARTGEDGGSNDSYYNDDAGARNDRAANGLAASGGSGKPDRARQPAPFEKTLARLFAAPRSKEVRQEPVTAAAPQPKPKPKAKSRPRSKLQVAGQAPATVSVRPPEPVDHPTVETAMIGPGGSFSGGDLEGSFGSGGAAAVTDAAFPPQETGRNSALNGGAGNTAQGQGNQTAGMDASSFDQNDGASTAPAPGRSANASERANANQSSVNSASIADAATATVDGVTQREMASVSMRPAVKGTLLTGARATLASALKSLAGGSENAAALTEAAPESVPGMLNNYRVAALIEIERKAVFDNAASVTSAASEGAMQAELGMLTAMQAQKEATSQQERTRAIEEMAKARADMSKSAQALKEAKRAELAAAVALEKAQVEKFRAFKAMPGAAELPRAAQEELNSLLGLQELAVSVPASATGRGQGDQLLDDDA